MYTVDTTNIDVNR